MDLRLELSRVNNLVEMEENPGLVRALLQEAMRTAQLASKSGTAHTCETTDRAKGERKRNESRLG